MVSAVIGKWGNAAALRIPQVFCKELGLGINDEVNMEVRDNQLVISKPANEHTLKSRMASWDGIRYKSEELDWGEPVGEEIW